MWKLTGGSDTVGYVFRSLLCQMKEGLRGYDVLWCITLTIDMVRRCKMHFCDR